MTNRTRRKIDAASNLRLEEAASGAGGAGTIMGIVIKALRRVGSTLSIVQVNARDSQQRPIQLVTGEASVQVKP